MTSLGLNQTSIVTNRPGKKHVTIAAEIVVDAAAVVVEDAGDTMAAGADMVATEVMVVTVDRDTKSSR